MRTTALFLALLLTSATLGAQEGKEAVVPDRKDVLATVCRLLVEADSYAAVECVENLGPPPVVARAYEELVSDLGEAGAVPEMVTMGRAGLFYLLHAADAADGSTKEGGGRIRTAARAMAYNVGSFTWPGWGREVAEGDRLAGADAARLCLRLSTELSEGPASLFASHWLVGAHHLTAGRFDAADSSFAASGACAKEAGDPAGVQMAAGYAALGAMLSGRGGDAARSDFERSVAALRADGSEDAVFYADQLASVRAVLAK